MTSRKPTAAFWIIVAVVLLPVVYVASFGPACWISSRCGGGAVIVNTAFRPVLAFVEWAPRSIGGVIAAYAVCAADPEWGFWLQGESIENLSLVWGPMPQFHNVGFF